MSLLYTSDNLQQDVFIKILDKYDLWAQIGVITSYPGQIDTQYLIDTPNIRSFIRPLLIRDLTVKGTTFEVSEQGAVSIPRLDSPKSMQIETLKWIFGRTDISKDASRMRADKIMFMNVVSSLFDNTANANKIFGNNLIRRITNADSTMLKVDFCKTILIPESVLTSEEILREHFNATLGSSHYVWLALHSEIRAGAENSLNETITHNKAAGFRNENSPPMEKSKVTKQETYVPNKDGIFSPTVIQHKKMVDCYHSLVREYNLEEEITSITGQEPKISICKNSHQSIHDIFQPGLINLPNMYSKKTLEGRILFVLFGSSYICHKTQSPHWFQRILEWDNQILQTLQEKGLLLSELKTFKVRELRGDQLFDFIKILVHLKTIILGTRTHVQSYRAFKEYLVSVLGQQRFYIERGKTAPPSKTNNWRNSSQTDSDERLDVNGRNYSLDHEHRILRYALDSNQSLERSECQSRGHVATVMDLASNWVALPSEIGSEAESCPNRTITHNTATGIRYEKSCPKSEVTEWETFDSNKDGIFRSLPNGWEEVFLHDGRILFRDHNTGVKTFADPRSVEKRSIISKMQYSKKFESKYKSFIKNISSLEKSPHMFEITVNRDKIVQDSFRIIMSLTLAQLKNMRSRLWIKFENEPGLDFGGVSKEWFSEVSKELLNPYYGLFEYSAIDNYTLQINPNSEVCVDNHLEYFRFLGRLAGMAALHKRLLNGFFIKPFYKVGWRYIFFFKSKIFSF